ncbi:MAG: hypothetical protein M1819_001610 [Sarea resinae]|nr:MAG: hypothetical protein M1819_001610 [Sarea resinae]
MDLKRTPAREVQTFSVSPPDGLGSDDKKRKRPSEPKFYSVRAGFKPGIYHAWKDCLAQVKGFKGATYKSFSTLTDAERFLRGPERPISSLEATKFYAIQNGRVPGVYTDWDTAQEQIKGWTKPKHKSFASRAEAEAFVQAASLNGSATNGEGVDSSVPDSAVDGLQKEKAPVSKKRKKNGNSLNDGKGLSNHTDVLSDPGTGPLPPDAEDGFDPNILFNPVTGKVEYKTDEQKGAMRLKAKGDSRPGMLRIFTDGSSLGNGARGAIAGVGVYFGADDERNVSEALAGPRQTNQRAELTAILRALDIAPRHRSVTIFTDSKYAIDCVTVWYINWRRNNWQTAAKKPVENRDLVESILTKIEERNALKVETKFEWLKGHADHAGNIAADRLAVDGARNAR